MLTRKHFVELANIVSTTREAYKNASNVNPQQVINAIQTGLMVFCANNNKHFDYKKFINACLPKNIY